MPEWLVPHQRATGLALAQGQLDLATGVPVGRPIDGDLWEVRSSLHRRREARVFVGIHDGVLVALHAFMKKTPRTPAKDLALARQRLKEMRS